jgi:Outer membrane protein beta-barrel domain
MKFSVFVCLVLFSCVFTSVSLFAQLYEVNPYAGYYWPGTNNEVGKFKSNQTLGVRGGFYITKDFEVGGNYSWSNHFQPADSNTASTVAGLLGFPQGSVRANLWEAEFTYNFGEHNLFGSAVRPYAVAGAGGITTNIQNNGVFVLNVRGVPTIAGPVFVANDVLSSGDTFFTFSYGGGVKAIRLWGPMGFFGDFRGRTIPNFFTGHGTNWPEVSAGLNFSWGER